MRLIFYEVTLPLAHVFTTSHGSSAARTSVIVELREGDLSGFGEAPVAPHYGLSAAQVTRALERVRSKAESVEWETPDALWSALCVDLAGDRFALCAIDEAAHDLWGKRLGKPVYELWGANADSVPPSDFTIGLDEVDRMVEKLEGEPGWPVYKIKLGTDRDVEIISALRERTDAAFRVDANTGWSLTHGLRCAGAFADLGVELIEQPMPADAWGEMTQLHAASPVPLIADESCDSEFDLDRCAACFDGINVKLSKCGGLTPARRLIAGARERGLTVMVGSMIESSVGVSAAAQLLPFADYADLDAVVLIARDIARGVRLDRGRVQYPRSPGCGVELLEALR